MFSRAPKITPLFAMVSAAVALVVLAIVFPSYFGYPFTRFNDYAIHFMLIFLGAGIFSLLIRKPRYTFVFFGACGFICLFLKSHSNGSGIERFRQIARQYSQKDQLPRPEKYAELKTVHINLAEVNEHDTILSLIEAMDPQVISFQEVTLPCAEQLYQRFSHYFPYHLRYDDVGLHGMVIFSKHRIERADTIYVEDAPILRMSFHFNGQDLRLYSYHSKPVLTSEARSSFERQLYHLGEIVKNDSLPSLLISKFSMVTWSEPVNNFCKRTGMYECRTGFIHTIMGSNASLLSLPDDHMFYSMPLSLKFYEDLIDPRTRIKVGFCAVFELENGVTYAW